jgi:hypothetical protein
VRGGVVPPAFLSLICGGLITDGARRAYSRFRAPATGKRPISTQGASPLAEKVAISDCCGIVTGGGPTAFGGASSARERRRGLHFVDAHPDLRKAFIERMRSLPFEGYVAMATLPSPAEYESTYMRVLNAMIKRRLMAAESQFAYLVFEKNSKVNQTTVRDAVKAAYAELKAEKNRHPRECIVEFSGKPNPDLSVPDFLLGTLGRFLLSRPDVDESRPCRDRKLFESLRDKYRLILDVDTWTEYSRRREIASWHLVT